MCLYSKKRKKLIAEEDIHCHKVLIINLNEGKCRFLTPYMKNEVESGVVYGSEKTKETWGETYLAEDGSLYYTVGKGFHHSFKNRSDAEKQWVFSKRIAIVDAYIPKGSEYFVGSYGPGKDEVVYASSAIRYDFDKDKILAGIDK